MGHLLHIFSHLVKKTQASLTGKVVREPISSIESLGFRKCMRERGDRENMGRERRGGEDSGWLQVVADACRIQDKGLHM